MKTFLCSHMDSTHDPGFSCCPYPWNKLTRCGLRRLFKAHGKFEEAGKKERGARYPSQAPPLLRQRKPYLTGSPPPRQGRRCRQKMSRDPSITPVRGDVRTRVGNCFRSTHWFLLIQFHLPDKSDYRTAPFPVPHLLIKHWQQQLK